MEIKKDLLKLIPKSKKRNQFYDEWLLKSSPHLKRDLLKLSSNYISKNFTSDFLNFGLVNVNGLIGLGSNMVNGITLKRLIYGINKFIEESGKGKKILVSVSSTKQKHLYDEIKNLFSSLGYDVFYFDNIISTEPTLSYALKQSLYDFGIYLDITDKYFSLKVLTSNGGLLTDIDYSRLNQYTSSFPFDFDIVLKSGNKPKSIKNKFSVDYYKHIMKIVNSFNIGKIDIENRVLINTRSKLIYDLVKNSKTDENIKVFLSTESRTLSSNDISSIDSYSEIYSYANHNKIDFIININGSGSKVSFAYKENKVWIYLSSEQLYSLLLYKFNTLVNPISNQYVSTDLFTSNIINELCKKNKMKLKRSESIFTDEHDVPDTFAKGDSFYRYSFNSIINNSNSFIPLAILLKYFDNKLTKTNIKKIILEFSKLTYYEVFWKQKIDSDSFTKTINYFRVENKIFQYDIKSIEEISESKEKLILKFTTEVGDIFIQYEKFKKTQYVYFNISDESDLKAFDSKTGILKDYMKISKGGYKDSKNLISKANLIKMILLSIFVIIIMLFVFTYLFDPKSFEYLLLRIGQTYNEPFVYLMLIEPLFRIFFTSALLFMTMRMFSERVTYLSTTIATILSTFVTSISFTFIAGPAIVIWYLSKKYRSIEISASIGVNVVLFGVATIIWNLYALIIGNMYIASFSMYLETFKASTIQLLSWIGFTFVTFSLVVYAIMITSKWTHDTFMKLLEWSLFKINKEELYKKIYEDLIYRVGRKRTDFQSISREWRKIVKILSIWIVGMSFQVFALSFVINLIADNPLTNYWQLITLNRVFKLSNIYIPIPGNIGTIELLMNDVLGALAVSEPNSFTVDTAYFLGESITFGYRFVSYYLVVGLTGIFFFLYIFKYNLMGFGWKNKIYEVEYKKQLTRELNIQKSKYSII